MLIKKSKILSLQKTHFILEILEDGTLSDVFNEYHFSKKVKAQLSYGKSQFVKQGERLSFSFPKETIVDKDLDPVDILYEDEILCVVHKPPFLLVHDDGIHYDNLQDRLQHQLTQDYRVQCVHRIDIETSGCVLFCKKAIFQPLLDHLFQTHQIEKEYLCWVQGNLKKEITIQSPLGKDRHNPKKMRVHPNGKKAITHVYPIEHSHDATLCRVLIETGRKHQIRVHLESIHHPILNDALYGSVKNKDGLLLQSHCLRFIHPLTNQTITVYAMKEERMTKI